MINHPRAESYGIVQHQGSSKHRQFVFCWGNGVADGRQETDMAIARPTQDANKVPSGGKPIGGNWSILLPTLWDYLTESTYSDGTARRPSTLLFFCEDGLVKVCLHDRDLARSAWSTGKGEEECLATLEAKLVDGSVEWRRDQKVGKK